MSFEELTAAATVIVAICGSALVILNFIEKIKTLIRPHSDQAFSVTTKLESHDRMLANNKARLDSLEKGNQAIYESLMAIMDHEITGNSVDKLKIARDNLHDYLIHR